MIGDPCAPHNFLLLYTAFHGMCIRIPLRVLLNVSLPFADSLHGPTHVCMASLALAWPHSHFHGLTRACVVLLAGSWFLGLLLLLAWLLWHLQSLPAAAAFSSALGAVGLWLPPTVQLARDQAHAWGWAHAAAAHMLLHGLLIPSAWAVPSLWLTGGSIRIWLGMQCASLAALHWHDLRPHDVALAPLLSPALATVQQWPQHNPTKAAPLQARPGGGRLLP